MQMPSNNTRLCRQSQELLLLAMAKLCAKAYDISPLLLDDRFSMETCIMPRALHFKVQSCPLCSSIAHLQVSRSSIRISLGLWNSDSSLTSGACHIRICDVAEEVAMRVCPNEIIWSEEDLAVSDARSRTYSSGLAAASQ